MSLPTDRSETARPPDAPRAASLPPDPARRPRSLADRLRLLLVLLLLPAFAVCVPVLVVTHFFGQRPAPKASPDVGGLQQTLQQSANTLLPDPSALGPDALVVTTRPDRLAARMNKVVRLAESFGGTASEGLSTATEKRLSIDLPGGRLEEFRRALGTNAPAPPSPAPTTSPGAPPGGHDYVDVIIRATGDDD